MYVYDIPYPNKDQYMLLYRGMPINVSKNISYLKGKMKAHRDEMGEEEEGTYYIATSDEEIVYSHIFNKGELGNSKRPYSVRRPTPDIKYKTIYVYRYDNTFREEEKENAYPVITFEAICDLEGNLKTDLTLLKFLADFRFYSNITVTVTNKALVSMATYMPLDKESFVNLAGCGEKLYAKCGEQFISKIKAYLDVKAEQNK